VNNLPAPQPGPEYFLPGPPGTIDVQASPVRFERFMIFLRRYWWIPVLSLLICTAGAGAYAYLKPPTYVSRAAMWETAKLHLPEGALFSEDIQSYFGTQIDLLKSLKLRDAALGRMDTNSICYDKNREPLMVNLNITEAPKSSVFLVQASSADATYSKKYLDALMSEYLAYKKSVRLSVSDDTLASISVQVERAERDLQQKQGAFVDFQRSNNLAVLVEESTIAGGYLARLKTQLSDYQLEERLLKAALSDQQTNTAQAKQLAEYKRVCDLLETFTKKRQELLSQWTPENSWVVENDKKITENEKLKAQLETDNPGIASMKPSDYSRNYAQLLSPNGQGMTPETVERMSASKELEVLKIQRERLSKYMRPKHPKIVKLDSEIARAQKLLEVFQHQSQQQLAEAESSLQVKIDNVKGSIKDWEQKVVEANARIADSEQLKQNVSRAQAVYERLVALERNVDISRHIDQETLSVLESASEAKRSYTEEKWAGGIAVGAGLVLGIGCVFLLALRDDRFTSINEVTDKLPDEIVGQVPEIRRIKTKGPLLLEDGENGHMFLESYRNLRSALLFLAVEGARPKVLLITSALPNEGKSTIATNLACTLAQGGANVLLVDGDLRRGALHESLGLQRGPGLAELLQNPGLLPQIIQTNSIPNLSFIGTGRRKAKANPGDLFLGPGLDQLLAAWREKFDHVIIDSTPVFAADDTSTLAAKADGTLFVVRSRYSGARQVQEALTLLCKRQARVLGLIFNRVNAASKSYSYYKYSNYYAPTEGPNGNGKG
jgi:capsular exopolysaccharide synthesis family protein